MVPPRLSIRSNYAHSTKYARVHYPFHAQIHQFDLVPKKQRPGSDVICPPKLSHPSHARPFHVRFHNALSVPRAKTSSWFARREEAAGPLVIVPPRLSHSLQFRPSHQICHSALSVPRAKTSIRLGPHETAPGGPVICATKAFPLAPVSSIPPNMPQRSICSTCKNIEAIPLPRGNSWCRSNYTT